jgi:hypothetical protein
MPLVFVFARAYPARTVVMLLCLLLGGVAEGVSVSSGVPLIALAAQPAAGGGPAAANAGGGVGSSVSAAVRSLGFEPTPGVLLTLLAGGIIVRPGLLRWRARRADIRSRTWPPTCAWRSGPAAQPLAILRASADQHLATQSPPRRGGVGCVLARDHASVLLIQAAVYITVGYRGGDARHLLAAMLIVTVLAAGAHRRAAPARARPL